LGWSQNHWSRSNLSRNPFGELTRAQRVELAIVDVEQLSGLVPADRIAVQLMGGCGRGKTTRLLALAAHLPESSYIYLPEDGPCPPIPAGRPLLIDEAQRLPRRVRRDILMTGLPLILATHRDLSQVLRRFGYTVHQESIDEGNTPDLLCRVLNRRIESARLSAAPLSLVSLEMARQLSAHFGTDIRAVESYLYDRVQLQVIQHGEMRFDDSIG
jgi:hypothetical protein